MTMSTRTFFTFTALILTALLQLVSVGAYAQKGNYVDVYELKDFPDPEAGAIKLEGDKVYVVHGLIDIGANYIELNGASIQGIDPQKDGIISATKGGVLRSRSQGVYIEKLITMCASKETFAYDFRDDTHNFYCNIFPATSVLEARGVTSGGVGKISGFNTTCIDLNYWNVKKGVEVSGSMNKFTMVLTYVTGIQSGAAVTFKSDAIVKDIVMNANYFIYGGADGIAVEEGAKITQGRLTNNLFQGPSRYTVGFDSFTPGWEMLSNSAGLPDSRARATIYMNDNDKPTEFISSEVFKKIEGETVTQALAKFDDIQPNRLIYTGRKKVVIDITASVAGISSYDDGIFSVAIMKNGEELILPKATAYNIDKGESFSLRIDSQVMMEKEDYIEVVMRTNNNYDNEPVLVKDLIFKVVQQY